MKRKEQGQQTKQIELKSEEGTKGSSILCIGLFLVPVFFFFRGAYERSLLKLMLCTHCRMARTIITVGYIVEAFPYTHLSAYSVRSSAVKRFSLQIRPRGYAIASVLNAMSRGWLQYICIAGVWTCPSTPPHERLYPPLYTSPYLRRRKMVYAGKTRYPKRLWNTSPARCGAYAFASAVCITPRGWLYSRRQQQRRRHRRTATVTAATSTTSTTTKDNSKSEIKNETRNYSKRKNNMKNNIH